MFCRSCGTENEDTAKFCRGCGLPIVPPEEMGTSGEASDGQGATEQPNSGDQTYGSQPNSGDQTYGSQPNSGEQTYGSQPDGGDQTYGSQANYGQPNGGQANYGQPNYGQPYPGGPAYPAPRTSGTAVACLILGIVSVLCCCTFILGIGCGIAAIVIYAVERKKTGNNGLLTAGLILGIIGVALSALSIIMFIASGNMVLLLDAIRSGNVSDYFRHFMNFTWS